MRPRTSRIALKKTAMSPPVRSRQKLRSWPAGVMSTAPFRISKKPKTAKSCTAVSRSVRTNQLSFERERSFAASVSESMSVLKKSGLAGAGFGFALLGVREQLARLGKLGHADFCGQRVRLDEILHAELG